MKYIGIDLGVRNPNVIAVVERSSTPVPAIMVERVDGDMYSVWRRLAEIGIAMPGPMTIAVDDWGIPDARWGFRSWMPGAKIYMVKLMAAGKAHPDWPYIDNFFVPKGDLASAVVQMGLGELSFDRDQETAVGLACWAALRE